MFNEFFIKEIFLTLMAILVKHPKPIKWTIHYSLPTKSSTSLSD